MAPRCFCSHWRLAPLHLIESICAFCFAHSGIFLSRCLSLFFLIPVKTHIHTHSLKPVESTKPINETRHNTRLQFSDRRLIDLRNIVSRQSRDRHHNAHHIECVQLQFEQRAVAGGRLWCTAAVAHWPIDRARTSAANADRPSAGRWLADRRQCQGNANHSQRTTSVSKHSEQ